MPSPEAPRTINQIPGISEEDAQELENDPNLAKVFLAQKQSGETWLIAVLEGNRESIPLPTWDCLTRIGTEAKIIWSCILSGREESFTSLFKEVTCLFSKKPDSKLPRHPIV